jgi:hypothetical protein
MNQPRLGPSLGTRASIRAALRALIASVTALALVLASAAGCAYRSEYVVPTDGRARVVWGSNDQPSIELAGTSPSPVCGMELRQITGHNDAPLASGQRLSFDTPIHAASYRIISSGGYWEPRYYGPNLNLVVVRPGHLPLLPRPPLFLPTLPRPVVSAPVYTAPRVSSGGGGFKSGGGGGGGGGKEAGALVIVALVIAVSTLPAIALGFASSFPEKTYDSSRAIDVVNAYNDLLRSAGSPCDPMMAAAPPAGGVL